MQPEVLEYTFSVMCKFKLPLIAACPPCPSVDDSRPLGNAGPGVSQRSTYGFSGSGNQIPKCIRLRRVGEALAGRTRFLAIDAIDL